MKANELRLGNYATDNIQTGVITVFNNDACVLKHKSGIIKCKVSDLNSIPLTEEWLEKFGFEKIKSKIDIFEKGRLRIWLGSGQSLCYWIEEDTTTGHYILSIQYVHQLQNLYFALTGEELTFKEE